MTGRRARRRPGENRERLLEAGLCEFGLFGFHGASTAAIAARAGVPQPHVYANFSNKQELFLEVCAAAVQIVLSARLAAGPVELSRVRSGALEGLAADAQRTLLQALAAVCSPQLAADLLPLLAGFRDAYGDSDFAATYGASGVAMLEHAIARN
ncbi:TetR/AcrR family transcriptional regulator [Leucobacter sp. USCH14]|uniref:TetR/AcrR family transcriptional regulator n=1 Tax=Leucobacter sp. USCH14 TaxID=3024838 RepID=UPI00309926E8